MFEHSDSTQTSPDDFFGWKLHRDRAGPSYAPGSDPGPDAPPSTKCNYRTSYQRHVWGSWGFTPHAKGHVLIFLIRSFTH